MAKGIYIIFTHSATPSVQSPGKWNVQESCEFVDRVKNRHSVSATAILDYKKKTIVKNRNRDGSFDDYIAYAETNYPDQMKALKELYDEKTDE